ncbi:MAG: hypothetical protein N2039_09090 [Gemmataceae bacterium]|nr:hypothetical protein [Gemmataceae bacterium]
MVLNQLFQYTPLQKTVSIILLALVDGRPRTLTLKQMMEEFLRHRVQVIRRRTEFLLREAKRRGHVLEGQLIAISSLDEVIQTIRSAPSRAEAKLRLQAMRVAASLMQRALGEEGFAALQRELGALDEYSMTEAQAEAVVRMQLGQLAALERDEILKEYGELRRQIVEYERLLASEQAIMQVIRADLVELRDKYGDERRTEIVDEEVSVDLEDLIPEELNVVTISHHGYIKRLPLNTYRRQHRGGKGVSGGQTREDDFIEHFFVASTHAYLLCFTNRGQVYWLKVHQIPQASRTSAGRAIANVLSLRPEEKITSVIPVREFGTDQYLLMATRRGLVKKTRLEEYSRPRSGGIIGINLDDGDTLIDVVLTHGGDEVLLATRNGMAIRFSESDVRPMGRNTRGVRGISLAEGDELVGMVVADPEGSLLTVCEHGYGKRTPFGPNTTDAEVEVPESDTDETPTEETTEETAEEPAEEPAKEPGDDEASPGAESPLGEDATEETTEEAAATRSQMRYRRQRRGGKGIRDIRTSERNGRVVGIVAVRPGDEIMLITVQGMVNRTQVDEIRLVGRNTQGVRIMNLNEGDRIASVARIARDEVGESPGTTASPDAPPSAPA